MHVWLWVYKKEGYKKTKGQANKIYIINNKEKRRFTCPAVFYGFPGRLLVSVRKMGQENENDNENQRKSGRKKALGEP